MAKAEHSEVLSVSKEDLFNTIVRYQDYPQFVDNCEATKVYPEKNGVTRVDYKVEVMSQDIAYTLDHRQDLKKGIVEWNLVESSFMKVNNGKWTLVDAGPGKTDVTYSIEVEFKIPVPGFILNKVVKSGLPSMVKAFGEQTKKRKA